MLINFQKTPDSVKRLNQVYFAFLFANANFFDFSQTKSLIKQLLPVLPFTCVHISLNPYPPVVRQFVGLSFSFEFFNFRNLCDFSSKFFDVESRSLSNDFDFRYNDETKKLFSLFTRLNALCCGVVAFGCFFPLPIFRQIQALQADGLLFLISNILATFTANSVSSTVILLTPHSFIKTIL